MPIPFQSFNKKKKKKNVAIAFFPHDPQHTWYNKVPNTRGVFSQPIPPPKQECFPNQFRHPNKR